MQREGEQSANYLHTKLTGVLATGPAIVDQSGPVQSCMQDLTKQGEELKEVMVREALVRHPDASARPVRAYPPFDKLLTAWKLSLPRFTNGLTTPVSQEGMAIHAPVSSVAYLPACLTQICQYD